MKARRVADPEPRTPNPEPRLLSMTAGRVQARTGRSGFLEQAVLGEVPILDVTGKDGFRGVWLDVFVPSAPEERFPILGQIIPAPPERAVASVQDGSFIITTRTVVQEVRADFQVHLTPGHGDQLLARLAVTLSGHGWVSAVGFALPLAVGPDRLQRRTTVGGQTRDEVWRLDQNDEERSEEWARKVSDRRARWPLWRIGGLLVDAPHHYLTWKSSALTTPPLPMDQGERCPGWVDYSDRSGGVRVTWKQMQNSPPAGMTVEGEDGFLWVWLHPPAVRPLRVIETITRTARLVLDFHSVE